MSLPHRSTHKGFKPRTSRIKSRLRRTRRLVSDWRIKHELGSRKRYVEDLDEVVSQIVRLRDGFRCVLCGSTYEPQAAHLWKRGKHATRWHLSNVWTNCSKCNIRHNTTPEPFMEWVAATLGEEQYDALRARAFSGKRFTDSELESMLDDLKQQHKTMKRAA